MEGRGETGACAPCWRGLDRMLLLSRVRRVRLGAAPQAQPPRRPRPWDSPGKSTCAPCWRTRQNAAMLKTWKADTDSPRDPVSVLLTSTQEKRKLGSTQNCTQMHTAAAFTMSMIWKQSKWPLTDEWINKMRYTYTMEYYSARKIMKQCHLQQHACN